MHTIFYKAYIMPFDGIRLKGTIHTFYRK